MPVHGTIDVNVTVGEVCRVADTLIKSNQDFDLLILPNVHHGCATEGIRVAGAALETR